MDFSAEFKGYDFPFQSADQLLAARDDGYRAMYYEQAKLLVENETLQQELTEWKRGLYDTLARETQTDVEREAYRRTLMAIMAFEKRLKTLADRARALPFKKVVDSL